MEQSRSVGYKITSWTRSPEDL